MKRAKKLSVIALTAVLSLSLATGAMANNGKGKGLETAPGQSENFSKGVTTEVIVTENVTNDVIVKEETTSDSSTETKTSTSEEVVVAVTTETEYHQNHGSREVTVTTTSLVTTTSSWDETTTVEATTITETPVTITAITETTILHRGAPGSNGNVISSESNVTTNKVLGETVVVDIDTNETVTKGEDITNVTSEVISVKRDAPGWGQNK